MAAGRGFPPPPVAGTGRDLQLNEVTVTAARPEAMNAQSGANAVQMSKSIREMQEASSLPAPGSAGVVNVLGRLMRQDHEGAWVDAEFDPAEDTPVQIQFASDTYFMLLKLYPDLREAAALGNQVTFQFKEKWVQIGKEGKELSEAELAALFG